MVVAESAAAPAAISSAEPENTSASVASPPVSTTRSTGAAADCEDSGAGGGSVAGMASAVPGVTARAPMAQASAMRRWTNMWTSWSAPLQRG